MISKLERIVTSLGIDLSVALTSNASLAADFVAQSEEMIRRQEKQVRAARGTKPVSLELVLIDSFLWARRGL